MPGLYGLGITNQAMLRSTIGLDFNAVTQVVQIVFNPLYVFIELAYNDSEFLESTPSHRRKYENRYRSMKFF